MCFCEGCSFPSFFSHFPPPSPGSKHRANSQALHPAFSSSARLMFEVGSLSFSASVQPLLPLLYHPTLQPTPTSSRFQEKICLLAPTLTKRNTKCSPPTSTRSSGFFWAVPGAEERGEEWGRRQRGKGMCPEITSIRVKQGFSVRWTPSAGLLAASSAIREPEGPGPL